MNYHICPSPEFSFTFPRVAFYSLRPIRAHKPRPLASPNKAKTPSRIQYGYDCARVNILYRPVCHYSVDSNLHDSWYRGPSRIRRQPRPHGKSRPSDSRSSLTSTSSNADSSLADAAGAVETAANDVKSASHRSGDATFVTGVAMDKERYHDSHPNGKDSDDSDDSDDDNDNSLSAIVGGSRVRNRARSRGGSWMRSRGGSGARNRGGSWARSRAESGAGIAGRKIPNKRFNKRRESESYSLTMGDVEPPLAPPPTTRMATLPAIPLTTSPRRKSLATADAFDGENNKTLDANRPSGVVDLEPNSSGVEMISESEQVRIARNRQRRKTLDDNVRRHLVDASARGRGRGQLRGTEPAPMPLVTPLTPQENNPPSLDYIGSKDSDSNGES